MGVEHLAANHNHSASRRVEVTICVYILICTPDQQELEVPVICRPLFHPCLEVGGRVRGGMDVLGEHMQEGCDTSMGFTSLSRS